MPFEDGHARIVEVGLAVLVAAAVAVVEVPLLAAFTPVEDAALETEEVVEVVEVAEATRSLPPQTPWLTELPVIEPFI